MKKTNINMAVLLCIGASSLFAQETRDPRVRAFVMPTRVVWTSPNSEKSSVANAEILLKEKYGQVPEGVFLSGSGCRMENRGKPASVLFDFGRELHGGVHLASGGRSKKAGVSVRVRFGESAAEAMAELGERGACNDHAIRDGVIDLPWLGSREIGNSGFRFARIDLVSEGVLLLESVRAVTLMRDMPYLGFFRCNDERLNEIWRTAAYTLHLCCQEYIWDGIKRDRLVWMGDMHPEIMAVAAVFGAQDVVNKSMDYMRATTAADRWMNNMPSYTLWWLRCQHDWYFYTGDAAYLRQHHEYIQALYANLDKFISDQNVCSLPNGFLDWPTKANQPAVDAGMHALMLMAYNDGIKMAAVLGDDDLQTRCAAGAARLKQHIPEPHDSKQVAALLALSGLREASDMNSEILARNATAGVSTFYGYYMLEAMAAAGDVQLGLDTVRDYWGAMLDMGATSFWEDFNVSWTNNAFRIDQMPVDGKKDIHGDYGDYCYKGFRHSFCHGWASGPAPWLTAHVLGIRPLEAGCRKVAVKPDLGDLAWAEGGYPTPLGVIRVRHEKGADGKIKTTVTAPEGVEIVR